MAHTLMPCRGLKETRFTLNCTAAGLMHRIVLPQSEHGMALEYLSGVVAQSGVIAAVRPRARYYPIKLTTTDLLSLSWHSHNFTTTTHRPADNA